MNYIELLNAFYERVQCSRISNNGQLLYYTLLAINNKSSWSDWFSRTNVSISGMMGISEKAFINARAELKQLGLIDFVPSKKRGECTKYCILYPTNDSTKEGTKGGTKEVQTLVQSTDINKLKQKQKKISKDIQESQNYFEDAKLNQAFLDYIDYRKSIKKPMTEKAIHLSITKLNKMAAHNQEKKAILEQTIMNGWQGLFPLKENEGGRKHEEPRGSTGKDETGLVYAAIQAGVGTDFEGFD